MATVSDTISELNITAGDDVVSDENCSEPELNLTSGTVTSSDDENCSLASPGRDFTTYLLVARRYDLAVIGCAIAATSLWFNAFLVNGLLRRGGRVATGVARSSLLLNLVASDCIQTTGGCCTLVVTLVGGSWPFGDIGCHLCALSTLIGHVVSYYTLASFIVERHASMKRKLVDMWKQSRSSVTSAAIATISRSRDRDNRRLVVASIASCWLASAILILLPVSVSWFPLFVDVNSLVCAFVAQPSSVAAVLASLVVGCLFPVVVGAGCVYRKYLAMSAVVESATKRCSRRQSSLVWLATRLTRRSSRLSVVSDERGSVSSACEVVLRDVDVYGKRIHDDEVLEPPHH